MTDLSEDFTGKLGPFPVWVWGAIAAALGLVGYLYYKKASPAPASSPATSSGAPAYQTAGMPAANAPSVASSSQPTDITAWIQRAAVAVAGQAHSSASDAVGTLTTWYEGGDITQSQKKLVDQAINLQGAPPILPMGVSNVTGNAPSSTPTPVSYVRSPNGSISAVLSDGTKTEFTKWDTFAAYQAQHPVTGPVQQLTQGAYSAIQTSSQNGLPPVTAQPGVSQ